jgi:predicted AAA+ superfamily ATPase
LERTGEQGLIDEAQKALEEAEALKKVIHLFYFIMKVIVICHGSKSKDLLFFNHSFLPGRSQHWILQSIQLLMFGL